MKDSSETESWHERHRQLIGRIGVEGGSVRSSMRNGNRDEYIT